MRVLFLTKYTKKGASSRLRTFQYLDFFTTNHISCSVSPFFDDEYLSTVYQYKRHNKWLAIGSFIRRIRVLLKVRQYDQLVIEKEIFPYFPSIFEWLLYKCGVRYIVDYDDAIFHNYDVASNPLIRLLFRNKIRNVVRYAAVVVAGNDYLKDTFLKYGATNIIVIPTVIDTEKYTPDLRNHQPTFTIGWIGSPITFKYLAFLKSVFEKLSTMYEIQIRYIGTNDSLGLPVEEIIQWNESTEAEEIAKFDVGIMPLEDNIWERGKCGYKLIQYMGCGIPVIATPIGVNNILIENGYNGFKAATLQEWEEYLIGIITCKAENRLEMGMNGRRLVETAYSLEVFKNVWLNILINKDLSKK